ncbi:polyprenyl synthetase family protein [Flavicella sediminum]|uniref:polyprenyl synthetase family protein n=1 Tax=Flavicella sediminum TaxID=2585141 RepID=UPI00111E8941|nr:polyprenyl synthetase family protein [Flavicella sediminum]
MLDITLFKDEFLSFLKEEVQVTEPKKLYEPITYILDLGGKRLRPVLALMGADAFGVNYKEAMHAAAAVEVFHNFTLLHDDIMDDAPLRRKKATVHEKWDVNTAILSGDAMLILSYKFLEFYEGDIYKQLMQVFNKTALEVCEGQQYDMDFETREVVSIEEYIKMIGLKTSVLVAAALKMGAVIAGASEQDATKIYDFGLNLGIAFQLQDDYLDAFGDPETFGKQVGGDIIENKKTYLYIQALANASERQKNELVAWYAKNLESNAEKISSVKQIFTSSGAAEMTKKEIKSYTEKAFAVLGEINLEASKMLVLRKFGEDLMVRKV